MLNKKTVCFAQEDMSSFATRGDVFFLNKKTCRLVEQDDMSSGATGGQVLLFNEQQKTRHLVPHEDMLECFL